MLSDNMLSPSLQQLVTAGVVNQQQAAAAKQINRTDAANAHHSACIAWLIDEAGVDASQVAEVMAEAFFCPTWTAEAYPIDTDLVQQHRDVILATHALPLKLNNRELMLAMVDPTEATTIDNFSHAAQAHIVPVVISYHDLADILQTKLNCKIASHRAAQTPLTSALTTADTAMELTSSQAVDTVDNYLQMAVQRGASDIHFEPYPEWLRIRMRIDGLLTTVAELPIGIAKSLITRLKVLSKLDIAEHRLPQDGRLVWQPKQVSETTTNAEHLDMRISLCPVLNGEKAVVRILTNAATRLHMHQLGMTDKQLAAYQAACAKAQGLILVTGPTGSGKSVSQYAALTSLNDNHRNISTAEDPVEIILDGVNQVHVNPKIGLTFASAMRAFLRQDPDVIMIGEIRDFDTAEMAIKAAQTGHLVFSTLHTNDAPQSLVRLENIGVAPHNIAASVNLIIAQRLARKLCQQCRVIDTRSHDHPFPNTIYRADPAGCRHCEHGYRGRTGVFQVLPISETMREIMLANHNSNSIAAQAAREGTEDLMTHGLSLVAAGVTSHDEIERVLSH